MGFAAILYNLPAAVRVMDEVFGRIAMPKIEIQEITTHGSQEFM